MLFIVGKPHTVVILMTC